RGYRGQTRPSLRRIHAPYDDPGGAGHAPRYAWQGDPSMGTAVQPGVALPAPRPGPPPRRTDSLVSLPFVSERRLARHLSSGERYALRLWFGQTEQRLQAPVEV